MRPRPYRFVHTPTPGYHYLRRPGHPRVRLPGLYGSPEFAEAYRVAMGGLPIPATSIGIERSSAGSFSALVASYYQSEAWLNTAQNPDGLSEGTRKRRKPLIERFRAEHGHRMVAEMTRRNVEKILEGKTPAVQLDWMKVLRALLGYAVKIEMRDDDPSASVKISRAKTDGFHTWTDDEIEIYRAHHALGTQARLALELGLETASRRCEVSRLCRANIVPARGDRPARIFIDRAKGSDDCEIQLTPELQAAIDAMPVSIDPRTPFLPFSIDTLGRRFAAWADEAGLPERCRMHGLRKACVRQLVEEGVAPADGMAVTGHKSLAVYQHYGKKYDKARASDRAVKARMQRAG